MSNPPPIPQRKSRELESDSSGFDAKRRIVVSAVLLFIVILILLLALLQIRLERTTSGNSAQFVADGKNAGSDVVADRRNHDDDRANEKAKATDEQQASTPTDDLENQPSEDAAGKGPLSGSSERESIEELAEVPVEETELPRIKSSSSDGPTIGLFSTNRAGLFGVEVVAERVAYVIDYSSSMNGPRNTRAKAELMKSVNLLNNEQIFTVVLYNTSAYLDPAFDTVNATDANRQNLKSWLDGNYPNGGTDPMPAMKEVLQGEYDVIFLVSDGEFMPSAPRMIDMMNTARIPIVTISLDATSQTLKQIAEDSGGQFVFIQ